VSPSRIRARSCSRTSDLEDALTHPGASWRSADDFESVVEDLRAKGVTFETQGGPETDETGVHTFGGHKVVWFKDPDGNTIAVDNGGAPS
jgi:catechol 2,3-dioxygenase-like lactoylglutathione lyase family enzyme